MLAKSDQNFVFAMLYCFSLEAGQFDDAINYIKKMQADVNKYPVNLDRLREGLSNLLLWNVEHQQNMRTSVASLK